MILLIEGLAARVSTWRRRGYHVKTRDGEYVTDPLSSYTKREAKNMAARDPYPERGAHAVDADGRPA